MKRWGVLAMVVGCGGAVEAGSAAPSEVARPVTPDPVVPSIVPDGDCHTTALHAPTQLFTPWVPGADRRGGHLEGGRLIRAGGELFAVLVPSSESNAHELTIYAGSAAGPFRPFATDVGEAGPLFKATDLYWAQRMSPSASSPAQIARRGADDRPTPVAHTENDFGYVVDGEDAYTFHWEWCPTTTGCPPPVRLARVNLATGTEVWSRRLERSGTSPVVADGNLYWLADSPNAGIHVFRMSIGGGEPVDLDVVLEPRDQNVQLARDEAGLVVHGQARYDADGSAEIVRYRIPLAVAPGHAPARVVLGRTFVGSQMAFDRSSVYFTYDGPIDASRNQTQTLARACLDGSRPTILLEGVSINAASTHLDRHSIDQMAIDDRRLYFTSNNGVWAIEK